MKIKAKQGESMAWLGDLNQMVSFTDGVADVDNEVGAYMVEHGFIAVENPVQPKNDTPSIEETKVADQTPATPLKFKK